LLVTWLALLGGVAPVYACAVPIPADKCCPEDGSAPCLDRDVTVACCSVAPSPAAAVSFSSARNEQAKPTDSGSPVTPVLPVSTSALAQGAARHDEICAPATSSARDASHTYLRTRRLRL
jgi:hypothetical protein